MKINNNPGLLPNIKKRQQGNLKLLNELVDILTQNNFKYSLAYGTLLGAVRNNDLIEWDADIDIIITKSALDFLIAKYPDRIVTNENTKHHFLTFPRFVDSLSNVDVKDPNSQYIDLFVVVPSSAEVFKKYLTKPIYKTKGLRGWTNVKYYFNHKIAKTLARIFVKLSMWWLKGLTFQAVYDKLYVANSDKYALTVWPDKSNYCLIESVDFNSPSSIEMCGRKYMCLNNTEKYLEQWYGKTWKTPIKTSKSIYYGYYEMGKQKE
ncbi:MULTISPECIES: diacylglycerol cholinephosphotransferase Mf1 [unclassified Mycoplasma]|uniref:diacylglycerol cholinephosphotransferase Mf1 n=1 Tax=unclassified Mycoplasma TaxID=2683645 RepID=UPI00216AE21C|nr:MULTISPECIES: LicD family protein [unclassified Mycoplasma]MCS4536839.1 LicD family protein [Mycoplasma sp. CSL7475-4]MCT4469678.1 LicD family protein [Mycoplasma sp. HS2188]